MAYAAPHESFDTQYALIDNARINKLDVAKVTAEVYRYSRWAERPACR